MAPVNNLFPHWLLQLLGGANNTADADGEDAQWRDSDEDEPHFYCQGDGLGKVLVFIIKKYVLN